MRFSIFLESETCLTEFLEPTFPKNVKKGVTNKAGVQGSVIKYDRYEFTTSLGNNVKVLFDRSKPNEADIIFYVNDKLDDKASSEQGTDRDKEILPNVLGVVKKVADSLKLKTITFSAYSGKGDSKTVKDLDSESLKPELLKALENFKKEIENYEIKYFPVTDRQIELAKKLKKEDPKPTPDIYKDITLNQIESTKKLIVSDSLQIQNSSANFMYNEKQFKQFDSYLPFIEKLRKFSTAIMSKTEKGVTVTRNRRKELYLLLLKKYFTEWKVDVDKHSNFFTLTR